MHNSSHTSWKCHPHCAWSIEVIHLGAIGESMIVGHLSAILKVTIPDCLISESSEEMYEICVFCPDTIFEWKKSKCPEKPGYMVIWCRSYCLCKRDRDKGWLNILCFSKLEFGKRIIWSLDVRLPLGSRRQVGSTETRENCICLFMFCFSHIFTRLWAYVSMSALLIAT